MNIGDYLPTMSTVTTPHVQFTRKQVEWLNKQFPERMNTATTTSDELRFTAGQRSVIILINSKVQAE